MSWWGTGPYHEVTIFSITVETSSRYLPEARINFSSFLFKRKGDDLDKLILRPVIFNEESGRIRDPESLILEEDPM